MAAFSRPLAPVPSGSLAQDTRETQLPDGFERLYAEHFDFVWRSLCRLGVSLDELDDAAQDVFIVFLRRRDEFRAHSSERTWLFGIATNVTHEYRRKRQRAARAEPMQDEHRAEQPSPLEQAASSQELRQVEAFLRSLDEDQRNVFILAELERMTAPEISAALSVKPNTVYSRLRLARKAFLAWFDQPREQP